MFHIYIELKIHINKSGNIIQAMYLIVLQISTGLFFQVKRNEI